MLRGIVALVVIALLGFPVAASSLVVADTLAGEGRFLYEVMYEQRALLTTSIADYARALPFAVAAVIAFAGLGIVVGRLRGAATGGWSTVVAATVCGLVLGLLGTGSISDPSTLALAVAGLLLGLMLRLPVGWMLAARAPRLP
jgi:hypothetical protein